MDLTLNEVSHKFDSTLALNKVSFHLPAGSVTGFVGNNGAGKSTAIRILVGLLTPDKGEVLANGTPITRDDQRKIGYVPEERGLYQQEKVSDQLIYIARTFGLSKERATMYVRQGLEQFGISHYANSKLADLSLGNQQRVQIICALLGDPEVLILDEPFSGLDPEAVRDLAEVLRVLARAKKLSYFLATNST